MDDFSITELIFLSKVAELSSLEATLASLRDESTPELPKKTILPPPVPSRNQFAASSQPPREQPPAIPSKPHPSDRASVSTHEIDSLAATLSMLDKEEETVPPTRTLPVLFLLFFLCTRLI